MVQVDVSDRDDVRRILNMRLNGSFKGIIRQIKDE